MHFLLRAVLDTDLLSMRRQGRLIWERYLSTAQGAVDTIVAVIRDRLGIPPLPAPQTASPSVFNESFVVNVIIYVYLVCSILAHNNNYTLRLAFKI